MLSTELFIITPFSKEQIDMASSSCIEEPMVPYSPYSVLVFNSRLEPFLKKYFENLKSYDYYTFVFRDIPYEGRMITTLILIDKNENEIELETQHIVNINLHISEINILHPNYLLFLSDENLKYPQSWVRTILPSFEFTRTIYYPDDEQEVVPIPSIYHNGSIYLDLSDDPNYNTTLKRLYIELINKIEKYYYEGTIPNQLEIIDPIDNEKIFITNPSDFLQFPGKLGDEVIEDIAGLKEVIISEKDEKIESSFQIPKKSDEATVFILKLNEMNFDLFLDQIGVEFLNSLKLFLEADEIITKKVNGSYYEIVLKKDNKFMESNLNIKEMFGYFYFTDHPLGLLVLDDFDLLDDSKILYDSILGKGGIFVPMEKLGNVISKEYLNVQLYNRKENFDSYYKSKQIQYSLNRLKLNTVNEINDYLFVEKTRWVSKRTVYRGTEEKYPLMLLKGNWDFNQTKASDIIKIAQNELGNDYPILEGPFSSLVVPCISLPEVKSFYENLNKKINEKYPRAKMF
jgi:hypothetical protein